MNRYEIRTFVFGKAELSIIVDQRGAPRWVTHEVMPAICNIGAYQVEQIDQLDDVDHYFEMYEFTGRCYEADYRHHGQAGQADVVGQAAGARGQSNASAHQYARHLQFYQCG